MIFASTSTGKLKVVVCEQVQIQKKYYDDHVMLCSHYCHNKRVCTQAGTDIVQWAVLRCYRCNKLVSITTGNSVSLLTACCSLGPLSSANWEACEIFQTHLCFLCVCAMQREKMKLDYSQNVRYFYSGFSQAMLSHISLLVIFQEFFMVWFCPSTAALSQRVPG